MPQLDVMFTCGDAGQDVVMDGTKYSPTMCYRIALEQSILVLEAYYSLARQLRGGLVYHGLTRIECLARAVELGSKIVAAWYHLGHSLGPGTVVISGTSYTQLECYFKFVAMDPAISVAWDRLGEALGPGNIATVNGVEYTDQLCFITALRFNDKNGMAWFHLVGAAFSGTRAPAWAPVQEMVSVKGKTFSRLQCLIEAVTHSVNIGRAWRLIAESMDQHETILIEGKELTRETIFLKAVELEDPLWRHVN